MKRTTRDTSSDSNSNLPMGSLNEPDSTPCNSTKIWRTLLVRGELPETCQIEIRFYTRDGKSRSLWIDSADRADHNKIRRLLDGHNARLPDNKPRALKFVEELLRTVPAEELTRGMKPGWVDEARGFCLPTTMYGTARGRYVWGDKTKTSHFAALSGSFKEYVDGVLKPAQFSPYLTLAILLPLAAPLLNYVFFRRKRRLISETGIIHWAGDSSTGKTTLAAVSRSVIDQPYMFADYRATERGAAEAAYSCNDLVVAFDEAENSDDTQLQMIRQMSMLCRLIAAGQSKAISTIARHELPPLTFTCFGVSTGPLTQASVAASIDRERLGQQARFIDIPIPSAKRGGIFETKRFTASNDSTSGELVKCVEDAIHGNYGHLFDRWIKHLLHEDCTDAILDLTANFTNAVTANGAAVERRVAGKFAVMFAADVIATKAGLLPWELDWVGKAVEYCLQQATLVRDPESVAMRNAINKISDCTTDSTLFPRVAKSAREMKSLRLPASAIGFVEMLTNGKRRLYLIPDRLGRLDIKDAELQRRIVRELAAANAQGSRTTKSRQFRIRTESGEKARVRAWRISRRRIVAMTPDAKMKSRSK